MPTAGGELTKDYAYDSQVRAQAIHAFADLDNDHRWDDAADSDGGSAETLLAGFEYAHNRDGSRSSELRTDEDGNLTTTSWVYDGLNRLAKETYDGVDGQGDDLAYTDSFRYDFSSNRIEAVHDDRTAGATGSAGPDSVTTFKYDANDRLLSEAKDVEGSSNTADDRYTVYGYGPGNSGTDQTAKTVHQGLSDQGTVVEQTIFTYDVAGRMSGVSVSRDGTTTTVSYGYDHTGMRVERTEDDGTNPPVTTVYHLDPDNPTGYAQVLEEGTDGDGDRQLDPAEVEKAYTLALWVLTQAMSQQVLHLLGDAHGSTRAALDGGAAALNASAVLERYAYGGYGVDLGLGDALTDLRYAGQMIDPVTGLSFNRARWYDPASGRFKQLDPWGGDASDPVTFNKYLYGDGNPVNAIDPSGMSSLLELLITIGGGESVEKLVQSYRAAKTSAEAAKMLVRMAFLIMEVEAFKLSNSLGRLAPWIASGYYLYEWLTFENRAKGTAATAKLAVEPPKVAGYIAALPGGIKRIEVYEGERESLWHPFLPGSAKDRVYALAFIPLTGRRSWDFAISTASRFGLQLASLIVTMISGNVERSAGELETLAKDAVSWVSRRGMALAADKQVWHHNEVMGVMELMSSKKHSPRYGGKPHTGGARFWEIIHNEDYK